MRMGLDALGAEPAELLADHLHLVARAAGADGDRAVLRPHQLGQPGAGGLGVALGRQAPHGAVHHHALRVLGQADILRAEHLALAHRQAPVELPQVFAERDLQDERLDLAERALGVQGLRPGQHGAQGLGIGRDPGEAVRRDLLAVQERRHRRAVLADRRPHGPGRGALEPLERTDGVPREGEEAGQHGIAGRGDVAGHRRTPFEPLPA